MGRQQGQRNTQLANKRQIEGEASATKRQWSTKRMRGGGVATRGIATTSCRRQRSLLLRLLPPHRYGSAPPKIPSNGRGNDVPCAVCRFRVHKIRTPGTVVFDPLALSLLSNPLHCRCCCPPWTAFFLAAVAPVSTVLIATMAPANLIATDSGGSDKLHL